MGFQAGAVPVYWGSETIKSGLYGPGPNSFIFAKDFKSGKDLAKHIRDIAKDDLRFKSFFAWKKEPITAPYQNHKDNDISNIACNICKKVAG